MHITYTYGCRGYPRQYVRLFHRCAVVTAGTLHINGPCMLITVAVIMASRRVYLHCFGPVVDSPDMFLHFAITSSCKIVACRHPPRSMRYFLDVFGRNIRTAFRTAFCIREAHDVFGTNIRTAFRTTFCIRETYNVFGTSIRTAFRTAFCTGSL